VTDTSSTLTERLASTPYDAYVYAYPHKTAYGPLDPAPRLEDVWRDEDTRALSLYIHVPFCEMRCGFCNLFTTPNPPADVVDRYVIALERQARRVAEALSKARDRVSYARFALGGGTPTLLDPPALTGLLDVAERVMGVDLARYAVSNGIVSPKSTIFHPISSCDSSLSSAAFFPLSAITTSSTSCRSSAGSTDRSGSRRGTSRSWR